MQALSTKESAENQPDLTPAEENYLRAIFFLVKVDEPQVRKKDLAQFLEVSAPSVSEMVKRLASRGFVADEKYGRITLTRRGESIAKKVTYNYVVIALFLTEKLKRDPKSIHQEVCELEHTFKSESIAKLAELVEIPHYCPSCESLLECDTTWGQERVQKLMRDLVPEELRTKA